LAKTSKNFRGVTIQQYETGYRIYRASGTQNAIKTATGMTVSQIRWCALTGDSENGMVNWHLRLQEEVSALRSTAIDTLQSTGEKASDLMSKQLDLKAQATNATRALLSSWVQYTLSPTLEEAAKTGVMDSDDLSMSSQLRETIKTLRPMMSLGDITATFSQFFKPVLEREAQKLSKIAQQGLDNKALLPASISLVEDARTVADVSVDPVQELLGEALENWTDEERQLFLETGREPREMLGPALDDEGDPGDDFDEDLDDFDDSDG
jgi:hypothetical protein